MCAYMFSSIGGNIVAWLTSNEPLFSKWLNLHACYIIDYGGMPSHHQSRYCICIGLSISCSIYSVL